MTLKEIKEYCLSFRVDDKDYSVHLLFTPPITQDVQISSTITVTSISKIPFKFNRVYDKDGFYKDVKPE